MPKLSIIIVNYNTKNLTLDCIESTRKERSPLESEIIVIDNGSTDGSVEALRKLQKKLSNLTLISNKVNLGFSKANNQGIKRATGKYILLLNSDTKVKRGALVKMVRFAEETDDVGVVGARLLNPDGTLQASCYSFSVVSNAIREYWLGQRGAYQKYKVTGSDPVTCDAIVAAAFLITPAALEKVGVLDERYFMYNEDLDYCRRVWKAGLKVYYLPQAEVVHYHGESGKHLAGEANQWRRLIPSSKIYHGLLKHYLLTAILWSGQKWRKTFR